MYVFLVCNFLGAILHISYSTVLFYHHIIASIINYQFVTSEEEFDYTICI